MFKNGKIWERKWLYHKKFPRIRAVAEKTSKIKYLIFGSKKKQIYRENSV